jgi:RNA polymerase sigma-70 factor (ECF subfamily)
MICWGWGAKVLSASGQEHPKKSLTLGDVLYAGSGVVLPEEEWASLVRSITAGDQPALHALYERSHRIVFTLLVRITANRETAEDLTIQVFHDIWRRAQDYNAATGTVLGWIMNLARSRALDRLRFESRKKSGEESTMQPDPRDMLELSEQREALGAAMKMLTADERLAIETTFFAGLTHAEAAARLNQPLGVIKTRIRSGLHKLRHGLAEARKNHDNSHENLM